MHKRPLSIFIIVLLAVTLFQSQTRQAAGQESANLIGTFLIVFGDGSAENPESVTRYFLASDTGSQIELIFLPPAKMGVNLLGLNRQAVFVEGTWTSMVEGGGGSVAVNKIWRDDTLEMEPDGVFGHQPWVSIMCKFKDYDIEPKDLAYFQGMYSASYPGLDHFWRELSFDLVDLAGSGAYGWYVLPYERSHYVPSTGGYMDWGAAAEDCTAVADADVYFPDYVGINLMFNATLDCCAWGGSWYLCRDGVCRDWRMTWEPPWGYENIGVIGHETGHGFGLPHSSGDYGEVYDNAWDVMSDVWSNGSRGGVDPVYGTMGQHTIAYHKNILEWIDSEQMVVVPTGTGRLIPLERIALPETGDAIGVKILINNSQNLFYTVESRRFAGYDSWLPGDAVIIHHVDVNRDEPAHVVDIDGNGDTGDAGAMWLVGETFVDSVYGITVSVKSQTDSGFVVVVENQCDDLCGVGVLGPEEGVIGQEYTFSANAIPIDATQPITYVWEADGQLPITHTGGIEDSVVYTWQDGGEKSITVTVYNKGNWVVGSAIIDIAIAPEIVEIAGPIESIIGEMNTYVATVQPISTTVPLTYVWEISGQGTVTQTGDLTETISFTWMDVGLQTITVTASNPGGAVVDTHSVNVRITSPEAVSIAGPVSGGVDIEQVYSASVLPVTTTLPITYVWQAREQETVTQTGGLTDTVAFTWNELGTKTITVTASNPGGVVSNTYLVDIQDYALESVSISGPARGVAGAEQQFEASVLPLSTTQPITYVWQAGGQEPVTQTSGLTDTISYVWDEPGIRTINLLAVNAMGEVTTSFSTEVVTPELDVVITGVSSGYSGRAYVLTAQVSPITTTQPLTYVWVIGEMEPITHSGGLSDTLELIWDIPGTHLIILQVNNAYVSTIATWEMVITERLFIPWVNK